MSIITVTNVNKTYKVFERPKGFKAVATSLFKRNYKDVNAIIDLNFKIQQGELIGYIGPNGAGKSTTIKMLCGLLAPTSGEILLSGVDPIKKRKTNAMQIGVVFGQRSQLNWDLPMEDTFEVYKIMYKIDDARYKRNVAFYTELLDMGEFLRTPIRQLSLGQKMRAELAVAMLHDPKILYLDEPTIGLDVVVKQKIRSFIKEVNKDRGVTVILTTHDMRDIEEVCSRIMLINKGKLLFDGSQKNFRNNYSAGNRMSVLLEPKEGDSLKPLSGEFILVEQTDDPQSSYPLARKIIDIPRSGDASADIILKLMQDYKIVDLQVTIPSIEDIVRKIYGD